VSDLDGPRTVYSASWEGPAPRIASLISTYRRPHFLEGLLASLERQTLPSDAFEVIVVDNGSGDGTWEELVAAVKSSPLRLCATSLQANRGPGGGRNAGLALVRSPVVAITDDDCLPTPGWLEAMVTAADDGADLVQGEVHADPDAGEAGPWDHVKWITEPTPFFETCNVAYRMSYVHKVGGFDEQDTLTAQVSGRAFGEDALLAWRLQEAGANPVFSRSSVVHHRVIPANFGDWIGDRRNLVGFPGLAVRSPLVADSFWHGFFLSPQTALTDLAVAGLVAAAVTRRSWPAVLALPWLASRLPEARRLAGPVRAHTPLRLLQLAAGDAVSLASLLEGSARHRRLVL
jgi:glycosyltransferase involved in cell wall biosynthesis